MPLLTRAPFGAGREVEIVIRKIWFVVLVACLSQTVHAVGPVPEPARAELPAWLPAPEPFVRVDSLAEAVGLRIALDGADGREHPVFVWDWKWVRLRDGRVVAARLEWVDERGEVLLIEESDDPIFRGARELTSFSELLGVDVVSVTDEEGIIRHVARAALGAGEETLSPGALLLGHGACWLRPDYGCPFSAPECLFEIGCLPQPGGLCACAISFEPFKIVPCRPEVIGHTCTSRRCPGQCVDPCTCEAAPVGSEERE